MIVSKVKICNLALSHIGARNRIEDIDESSSEAEACNMWYDLALETSLEKYDWAFARKRVTLTPSSFDPPEGVWSYAYQWPVDCVAPRRLEYPGQSSRGGYIYDNRSIINEPDAVPFDIGLVDNETKAVFTDLDDAVMVYTSRVTNPVVYTMGFINALSYSLAHFIAMTLTGKITLKENMYTLFMREVSMASAQEGNQSIGRAPRDADVIRGRL